ncbi:TetR/AcrR family transcriptional regulator [Streptomyces sp. CS7]|uniref:TetR/AcrR family transcriptional regulator n=1 Tax=Streptomyces TaxID=1883 RepID=UPI0021B4CDDD|nr:TetR/AcrR family transcriptional regulator [Streptomyces sp. CS-7]MCT6779749.1 TetR/AcrR family transcriptional regulator [Streptomyces sp. CS-7]
MDRATDGRQTRNAERTRRAVLDAAVQVILDKGAAVTLAQVAAAAGVSKSGLIHHFGSRDQLVVALVEDTNERFRETVRSHLDLSENYPGKMLRAYVRALCAGSAEAATARDFTSAPMWGGLYTIPAVVPVMEENAAWWDEQLALDGISPERIMIVRRAAEGIAMAAIYGEQDGRSIPTARDLLLELATEGTFRTPL